MPMMTEVMDAMEGNYSSFSDNYPTVNITDDYPTGNATGMTCGAADITVWKVLEGIIACLGMLGNGVVLFVFFKDKSMRSLVNSFIINQSFIDFTTSFVFLLICYMPRSNLDPSSTAHLIYCQIWVSEFVLWALFISSSLNLICITLDRYVAIIFPTKYRSSSKRLQRRVKLIAVFMWLSGFILDCYWPAIHIIHPTYGCIPSWPNDILQGTVGVYIFFVTYAGPLGVMAFSYARILSKLRKQAARAMPERTASPRSSPISQGVFKAIRRSKRVMSERSAKATRNVIKTMITVSLIYAVCWAPIAFNYLVYNLGGYLDFYGTWYAVTKIFVYINMCANPFIYTMQYQQFQKGFERAFKVKIFKGLPESGDVTKTKDSSDDALQDVAM